MRRIPSERAHQRQNGISQRYLLGLERHLEVPAARASEPA